MELAVYQHGAQSHHMMIRPGGLTRDVTGMDVPNSCGYRMDPSEHRTLVTTGPSESHTLGMEERGGGGDVIAMRSPM